MNKRERHLVSAGVLTGVLITLAVVAIVFFPRRVDETHPPAETMAAADQPAAPETTAATTSAAIELSEEEQKAIGVEISEVDRRALRREIQAVARVEQPETALSSISARISGRIDRLFVSFTGQTLRRNDPVASIYSPEVVAGSKEYKLALQHRQNLSASKESRAIRQADEIVEASRQRLELWGLTPEQIESIAASAEPALHITTYSSTSGVVTARNVTEGQYVTEGDILFTLTDLTTVWVKADVFESDIASIRPRQSATISSPSLGQTKVRGTVSFIEPTANEQTRTVPVRIEVANPQLRLRPGMFANVVFTATGPAKVLAVPRSAVIDTGKEKIVYVVTGDRQFERRAIETSTPEGDFYPVVSGLADGDRVVTHGAFLIDSQTRLTSGMTGLFGGSKSFSTGTVATAQPAQPAGNAKIGFRIEPNPPRGGAQNTLHVTVTDASGKPITDAQVKVTLIMPAMPSMGMPEMRSSADAAWTGSEYTGTINISMAGPWNVVVEARRGGQLLATYRTRFDAS